MNNTVFPSLPGLTWQIRRSSEFKNLVQPSTAPGFDTVLPLGPDPLYHFELTYNYLRDAGYGQYNGQPVPTQSEVDTIMDFFESMQGNATSFRLDLGALTKNLKSSSILGAPLTPDASGYAPIQVTRVSNPENIYELVATPTVYMNGVPLVPTTDFTIQGPGVSGAGVTYPGLVVVMIAAIAGPITADFGWYYRVKFEESLLEIEAFSYLLWKLQSIKMITSRV